MQRSNQQRHLQSIALKGVALFCIIVGLVSAVHLPAQAQESELTKQLAGIFGASSGVAAIDVATGQVIFAHNASASFKPASVQKVVLSGAVLDEFPAEHQFKTQVWAIREGDTAHKLIVRGFGDPALRIEELWLIARKLKRLGIERVGELIVDDSAHVGPKEREGQRAYLAGSSALAFNYNSLTFEICPGSSGGPARVTVDPWEFPVKFRGSIKTAAKGASFSIDEDVSKRPGEEMAFRLSGTFGATRACTEIYRTVSDPALYLGATMHSLLERLGIKVVSGPRRATLPAEAALLYTHRSKPLAEILRDLNRYSNNFIAEQIVLLLGQRSDGTLEREAGLARITRYVNGLGFPAQEFSIIDGSGLSHENRLSARILAQVLSKLAQNSAFGPEFVSSLPYPGGIGTMREREFEIPPGAIRAKTGTINGVSSLAGYLTTKSNRLIAFAVLQNGMASKDRAIELEKRFVKTLYRQ